MPLQSPKPSNSNSARGLIHGKKHSNYLFVFPGISISLIHCTSGLLGHHWRLTAGVIGPFLVAIAMGGSKSMIEEIWSSEDRSLPNTPRRYNAAGRFTCQNFLFVPLFDITDEGLFPQLVYFMASTGTIPCLPDSCNRMLPDLKEQQAQLSYISCCRQSRSTIRQPPSPMPSASSGRSPSMSPSSPFLVSGSVCNLQNEGLLTGRDSVLPNFGENIGYLWSVSCALLQRTSSALPWVHQAGCMIPSRVFSKTYRAAR